jgi:signal transduction histidine kinase
MDKYFMISCVATGEDEFATISMDITVLKKAEKALDEKNRELENYLFVASHDLRSPLVNVQGFSQRIQRLQQQLIQLIDSADLSPEWHEKIDAILKEKMDQSLDFIFSNTQKMDHMINGLLKISRTGRIEMTYSPVSIQAIIEDILQNIRMKYEGDPIQFSVGELPGCYGDLSLLNQLFTNLIENAIKYRHPDRLPEIHIAAIEEENRVIYSIQDNGIGIDKRHLDRIWDVFYRVDTQGAVSGDGLGLSIVRKIVEKHQGHIWVGSEPDKGTTFYVELPKPKKQAG